MRRTGLIWLAGAFLTCTASGCSVAVTTDTAPVTQSPSAPAVPVTWREPAAYTFVLTTGCTRGFVDARYRVTVRDGRAVSSTALNQMARDHSGFRPPTLKDIDNRIAVEDLGNTGVRRERDHSDGHPVAFGFDRAAMAGDSGECFEVSGYEPR